MKRDGSQVFHVTDDEVGLTLAGLLKKRLPELSWNQARKHIDGRRIQIHGNLCLDEGRRLQAGEVVKLLAQAQASPPRDDDVRIRYLDAHVVVVEKPAGMTTLRHSEERFWPDHRKQRQPTLDEVLARLLAQKSGRRDPRSGPGPGKGKHAERAPEVLACAACASPGSRNQWPDGLCADGPRRTRLGTAVSEALDPPCVRRRR